MAIGDNNDMQRRITSLLPSRWWANVAPLKEAVIGGLGDALSNIYSFIQYTKAQSRIKTAFGPWLDLIAFDFFGMRFRRRPSQNDDSFKQAIIDEILRPRVTRDALQKAVSDLTNTEVTIFEPFNPQDTGGWGVMFAFDAAGAWGDWDETYTVFLDVVKPQGTGIPTISGFDDTYSGFDKGYFYFVDDSQIVGPVTDQDVYDCVEATRASGVTVWVKIGEAEIEAGILDIDFILDQSLLG